MSLEAGVYYIKTFVSEDATTAAMRAEDPNYKAPEPEYMYPTALLGYSTEALAEPVGVAPKNKIPSLPHAQWIVHPYKDSLYKIFHFVSSRSLFFTQVPMREDSSTIDAHLSPIMEQFYRIGGSDDKGWDVSMTCVVSSMDLKPGFDQEKVVMKPLSSSDTSPGTRWSFVKVTDESS